MLCTPASSAPSERAFSAGGLIASQQRASISPADVDSIIFLNKNLKSLAAIDGIKLTSNDTNMVFIELPSQQVGVQLAASLARDGVKVLGGKRMRLVTHLDVSEQDIDAAVGLFRKHITAG